MCLRVGTDMLFEGHNAFITMSYVISGLLFLVLFGATLLIERSDKAQLKQLEDYLSDDKNKDV